MTKDTGDRAGKEDNELMGKGEEGKYTCVGWEEDTSVVGERSRREIWWEGAQEEARGALGCPDGVGGEDSAV